MSPPDPAPPTRARYGVALWLCGLSAVLYLDRICMSQAVGPIQKEFGLSGMQMSYVMMAFSLAYGLFEVPTGRLGDKNGSRAVLTRVVVWWSAFTALTGACTGLVSLIVVRFLFGAGEAGAFPNAARVVSRWFPLDERGRVQGLMLASAQIGAVSAPAAAAQLIEAVGWRGAFVAFGLVGVAWAAGFWWWFRDDPAAHPGVNAAELAAIRGGGAATETDPGPVPWRAVFANRGILVLGLIMILASFYTYFFYSWFPKYLDDARGVPNVRAGWLASLVLGGSAVGMLFGGWLADRIPRWTTDAVRARRRLAVGCYLAAAGCMAAGTRCDDPVAMAGLFAAGMCAMHVTIPNWWSVAIPQCGRHVGALFGLMNGVGVVGALSSQWFVGAYSDWRERQGFEGRERWDPVFDVYTGVLVCGAVAWALYRWRPLDDPRNEA